MDEQLEKNKQYLKNYIQKTEEVCPELLELFYPITRLAIDYSYVFDEICDDERKIYFEKNDIYESIELVRQFLKEIGFRYLEKFDKSLKDGTFDIFHIDNLNESPDRLNEPMSIENQKHLNINIPINYTVQDGGIIIHEFFHFTNSTNSGVRDVFTELISIYMELRYYQFIEKKGYSTSNFYNELFMRILDTYSSCTDILYSGSALDVYYNTDGTNKDNILFIDKFRDRYEDELDNLIEFFSSEDLVDLVYEFHMDASYLLGGIISINLLKEPKLNDIKIKYINENIDKLSIKEVFDILNIDLDKYQDLVDSCKETYEKIEGVLDESNSYNRSYLCR